MVTLRSCCALAALAALSAMAQWSRAQEADFVLRTYEVGDLVLTISDKAYGEAPENMGRGGSRGSGGGGFGGGGGAFGGGGGTGGGGVFSISGQSGQPPARFAQFGRVRGERLGMAGSSAVTMDGLIDAICSTVEPTSWVDQGGVDGTITAIGSALVVRHTAYAHQQIEGLLSALRAYSDRRRTLTIDARWLLLTSDELDQLQRSTKTETQIDAAALKRATRKASTIRGVTNCMSGQLVYLVSGTRRNVVSSYIPVVGSVETPSWPGAVATKRDPLPVQFVSEKGVGYQPIVTTSNLGALLEIRPTLLSNDESVVIDLKSTITVPRQVPLQPGPPLGPPHVDRMAIETQEFATTLRAPLGKPTLVGGMTFFPPKSDEASDEEVAQLYLILEVR